MRFELLVLGSSAAVPTAERFCSAQLLRTEASSILIDCGEGTQIQLMRAGIATVSLDVILISHLHGDHYFGLPGLLTSMLLNQRERPLTIISPPGLKDRLDPLLELTEQAWPFVMQFLELPNELLAQTCGSAKAEKVYVGKDFAVAAFPLQHRIPTAGYLITEKARLPNLRMDQIEHYNIPTGDLAGIKEGKDFRRSDGRLVPNEVLVYPPIYPRSFAYCSDTRYCPELVNCVATVDLLYHEATFLHELRDRAVATMHSTALEAAQLAREAAVKQLIIGHFSSRYPSTQPLLEEARSVFKNTHVARELERYIVPFQTR